MNYRQFVKENFNKLPSSMPAKEKMKKIGEMWRMSQHSKDVKKGVKKETGGGMLSSLLDTVGLGVSDRKTKRPRKQVRKQSRKQVRKETGAGMLSSLLDTVGLGVEPEDVEPEGSGMLSNMLEMAGLGFPDKAKVRHLNKMHMLEQKMHKNGKLTPTEHKKLRVYHHLHGKGFFDSILSGAEKLGNFAVDNLDTIKKVVPEIVKYAKQS